MVLIIVAFLLGIIIFIFSIYHNKIVFLNIKINNIEEKLNSTLIKRKELLKDSEEKIKSIIETDKSIYDGMNELSNKKISMMELDRKLLVYINEFYLIRDKYPKLQVNEDFEKIVFSINETEDLMGAYKDYYNDIISKYNKLIKSFPVIIISFIKRRKEKEFFDKKSINESDYNEFKY